MTPAPLASRSDRLPGTPLGWAFVWAVLGAGVWVCVGVVLGG